MSRVAKHRATHGVLPVNKRGRQIARRAARQNSTRKARVYSNYYRTQNKRGYCVVMGTWVKKRGRESFRGGVLYDSLRKPGIRYVRFTDDQNVKGPGACGQLRQHIAAQVFRRSAAEDARGIATGIQSFRTAEGRYPTTVISVGGRGRREVFADGESIGWFLSAGNRVTYTKRADNTGFRLCVFNSRGPWAEYDSTRGGITRTGLKSPNCTRTR